MDLSEKELERLADRIADKMISHFEKEGLVLSRKELAKQAQLKERVLRKSWITYREISDSNIWKNIGVKAVKTIVKQEVDPDCIDKTNHTHKVHRSEVERIAKNRGTL